MKTVFRNGKWAIALVCAVLGFMLSTQFRVQQQLSLASKDVTLARSQSLTAQVADLTKQNEGLVRQATELRSQLQAGGSGSAQVDSQLLQLQAQAGLMDLQGSGVIVTMDDAKRPLAPGENPNAFIIHDEDILRLVNELFASQAEAISINGHRLIDRTAIRCVGPVVQINGIATAPPLKISAIGDPVTLEAALRLKGGIMDSLQLWGIQVSVQKSDKLVVPAFEGALTYRLAQPVKGGH